ncbi:amino acid transporter [Piedraia hortae CBS 480.64]|uniref:Amino acid transporter n=1 Tax=Piedraia hortae CBS 480.64 TaxID=1314780 RepID=A0A6A7BVH3_9PEZI|nr:amino acid transporter [Piedraia hortae CBS 480.64]
MLQANRRDSLELASLASSDHDNSQARSRSSSLSGPSSSRKLSLESQRPSGEFEFTSALFPLSASSGYAALGASTADAAGRQSLERNKSLTLFNGLSLVVGLIIGSGIFSSPASVNNNVGSPGAALIVWLVSGILAWTGAASYAELGGAIPLNGGAQAYLSTVFGQWCGFLFTWCAVTVLKPGSAAIIAIIFGEYMTRAALGTDSPHDGPWAHKAVAMLGLVVVTCLNCISTKLGTRSADVFMFLKFVGLAAITATGIFVAVTGERSAAWRHTSWFEGTSTSASNWAVAFYAGLWAYDGWDNTSYVVGEMINPGRDLPRVMHTSLPLVITAYLLANLAYVFVLPAEMINHSNTVAVAFGQAVFGRIGSLFLALVVGGSCFGALNATTFTAGRLVCSAGQEGYIPSVFGTIGFSRRRPSSPRARGTARRLRGYISDAQGLFHTPFYAMVLNMLITSVYVLIGDFETLTTFYGVASYLFYFAAVVGLIVLRVKEPELERPYKCWMTTPIVFCCVSLFLVSRAVFAKPLQALGVFGFLAIGLPLYVWQLGDWKFWKRWRRS